MDKGEKLFSNLPESKRKRVKIMAGIGIVFGILGITFSIIAFFVNKGFSMMSIQGLLFGSFGGFFGLNALSREFCVYENGIQLPTTFWKEFFTFEEIEYIDLNTSPEQANWEIEIKPESEEKRTYKKEKMDDWGEFIQLSKRFLQEKVEIRGLEN